MFFSNEVKSVQEQQYQQLSELGSVFAAYKRSFHTIIPGTTVRSMVATLDTILRSNHPHIKVGVLFESLNYEALFTSEGVVAQNKVARFLRVHQKLKIPVNSEKSRMSFLYLLDAAKKAMEEGTLERDTAEDIRIIIDDHRDLFESKPCIRSYGASNVISTPALNSQAPMEQPRHRPISRPALSIAATLLMGVGGAYFEGIITAVTEQVNRAPEPSVSGYNTLR